MSNYTFSPTPQFGMQAAPFVTWENSFTEQDCDRLVNYAENLAMFPATVGGHEGDAPPEIRKSKVSWLAYNDQCGWVYDKLAYAMRMLNAQFYRFDLTGFQEDFQYTVYYGNEQGHYDWHQDINPNSDMPPRKFSLVLQLSKPSEYEGGDLEIFGHGSTAAEKKQGLIVGFPSYMPHRVTPVTAGVRRSLVAWVCGPQFR
jgi:PKHD-type hydroxylase